MAVFSAPFAITATSGVAVVDTVTIAQTSKKVRVLNLGASDLFVRHDGTAATVNGADNVVVPAEGQYVIEFKTAKVPVLSVISAAATQYTVVHEA